jgi:hypothetical protein
VSPLVDQRSRSAPSAAREAGLAWRPALVGTLLLGAVAVAFFAQNPNGTLWSAMTPADCAEYCEAHLRCGPLASRPSVQQPLNSWSNAAFVFVGLLALRARPRAPAVLFAASAVLLGIGSFSFHAAITRETQWLDMVGTYAAIVAVAALGLQRLGARAGAVVALALVVDVLIAWFKWQIEARVALPLLVLAAAVPMALAVRAGRGSAKAALLPLGLLLIAVALREADVRRVLCWPDSVLFQGHALWHVLCAASLGASWHFLARLASPREDTAP